MLRDRTPSPAVETVPTPNPDALMFRVGEVLVPSGTWEYRSRQDATRSPLAQKLLANPGSNSSWSRRAS